LLVSATTTLLRCTVEALNATDKKKSALALLRLLDTLRTARREHDWDLSVLCIDTCGQSIERVAVANHIVVEPQATVVTTPTATTVPGTHVLDTVTPLQHTNTGTQPTAESNEFQFSLDIPWDHLWDDIAEPWGLLNQH
jgi:ABC-type arginine transport system ATPase subunit